MNSFKLFFLISLLNVLALQGQTLLDSTSFGNTVYGIDLFEDASKIFVAGKDSTVSVWDRNEGQILKLYGHKHSISSIDYDSNKQSILTGSYDNTAILWGMDGELLSRFVGHDKAVINISQNQELIGTASRDNTAKIWERNGTLKFTLEGHSMQVNSILFVPEEKWLITAGDDSYIKIWSAKGDLLKSISHHDAGIRSIAVSAKRKLIVAGHKDGNISIIDFNGTLIKIIEGHSKMISSIKLINNDDYFITGSADMNIRIWNIRGEPIKAFKAHESYISGLAFSNNVLVSSSGDKSVKVWQMDFIQNPNEKNLTNNNADDRYGSYSPDGRQIVFESNRKGNWDIFLMEPDGNNQLQLTIENSDDRRPSWHPSGKKILFESNRAGKNQLYEYCLKSKKTKLLKIQHLEGEPVFARYSPDGTKIAFTENKSDQKTSIVIVNRKGRKKKIVADYGFRSIYPFWSPDGKTLAFFSRHETENKDDEIYTINVDRTNEKRLTTWEKHNFCPSWSFDSNYITYVTSMEGSRPEIYIMDANGENQRRITYNKDGDTLPTWSPDNKKLLITGYRNGNYEICEISLF